MFDIRARNTRYDRRSCCSISIARARRALTQHTHRSPPPWHTLEPFVRGSRQGVQTVRDGRLRDYEVRAAPAYGDIHCCLANMRIVAHFTGVNGSSRAGDASGISCHLTMNITKRSSVTW